MKASMEVTNDIEMVVFLLFHMAQYISYHNPPFSLQILVG